jgi:hypothetical protein
MRRSSRIATLLGACPVLAATLVGPGAARSDPSSIDPLHLRIEQATCGQPGLSPCPLQRFMRESVAAPLARGDTKTIADSLRKVATSGPSEFTTWPSIASAGATAAERGDTAALRSACNACHKAFRAEYRAKYRARPLGRGHELFLGDADGSSSF